MTTTLINFVKKHLDDKFYLDNKGQRRDLRVLIFREIIGNMLVHREYTNHYSSDFIIYNDRVEVTNPNKAFFRGLINPNDFCPFAKNPTLRRFFTAFGWAEEIGSGVRNVTNYLTEYTTGSIPVFMEDDLFKVIIPIKSFVWGDKVTLFFRMVDKIDFLDNERIDLFKQLSLNSYYDTLDDVEFLQHLNTSWMKLGYMNKMFKLHNYNDIENIRERKDTSMPLLGYMKARVQNMLCILGYCILPSNIDELLKALTMTSRPSLGSNYIKPMMESDLIRYTIPDNPRSKKQKYILTSKGKAILGGFENTD